VLALVLGPLAERALRQSLIISGAGMGTARAGCFSQHSRVTEIRQ
jgi:TctA family transporter